MKEQMTIIVLGELHFKLKALPYRQAKVWRKRLTDEIKPMFDQFSNTATEFSRPSDLVSLWPIIELIIYDGIDAMFELLLSYDPALEASREEIEKTATDKQIVDAFKEILTLIDPFGAIALIARRSGLGTMMTSQKLRSPNGGYPSSGQTD